MPPPTLLKPRRPQDNSRCEPRANIPAPSHVPGDLSPTPYYSDKRSLSKYSTGTCFARFSYRRNAPSTYCTLPAARLRSCVIGAPWRQSIEESGPNPTVFRDTRIERHHSPPQTSLVEAILTASVRSAVTSTATSSSKGWYLAYVSPPSVVFMDAAHCGSRLYSSHP